MIARPDLQILPWSVPTLEKRMGDGPQDAMRYSEALRHYKMLKMTYVRQKDGFDPGVLTMEEQWKLLTHQRFALLMRAKIDDPTLMLAGTLETLKTGKMDEHKDIS